MPHRLAALQIGSTLAVFELAALSFAFDQPATLDLALCLALLSLPGTLIYALVRGALAVIVLEICCLAIAVIGGDRSRRRRSSGWRTPLERLHPGSFVAIVSGMAFIAAALRRPSAMTGQSVKMVLIVLVLILSGAIANHADRASAPHARR